MNTPALIVHQLIRAPWRRILLACLPAVVVALAVVASSPQAAQAFDPTSPGEVLSSHPFGLPMAGPGGGGGGAAGTDDGSGSTSACADPGNGKKSDLLQCLPLYRWTSAMKLQSNVPFTMGDPLASVDSNIVQKSTITTFMTLGNLAWYAAAIVLNLATNYTIGTELMKPINAFAASIGSTLMSSALLGVLAAISLVGLFVASMRRGFQMKRLWMLIGSTAAVAILVGGAMADSGSGDNYKPGPGSPAWIAKTVATQTAALTDPIAKSVAQSVDANSGTVFSKGAKKDPNSCYTYIETMNKAYEQAPNHAAAPEILSRWWVSTAYKSFAALQYGQETNVGADYALCHQLESVVASPESHQMMTDQSVRGAGGNSEWVPVDNSLAFSDKSTAIERNQQLNFWALCQPTGKGEASDASAWKMRIAIPEDRKGGTIAGGDIGGEFSPKACANYAKSTPTDNKYSKGVGNKIEGALKGGADGYKDFDLFIYGTSATLNDSDEGIRSIPALYAYANNVTGADRTTASSASILYGLSALFGAIAIIILSIALFLMKTLSYLMAMFMIVAALAGLLTQGGGNGGAFLKQWFGYTVITSITNLLLAVVFMVTSALNAVGASLLAQSSWMIAWVGITPALAVVLINWSYRRMFKARSPFSLRGMQSFASSPAGVAGAAMAGGTLLNQGGNMLREGALNRFKSIATGRGNGGAGEDVGGGTAAETDTIGASADGTTAAGTGAEVGEAVKDNEASTGQSAQTDADGATAAVDADGAEKDAHTGDPADDTIGAAAGGGTEDADLDADVAAAVAGGTLADRIAAHQDGAQDRAQERGDWMKNRYDRGRHLALGARGALSDRARALGTALTTGWDQSIVTSKGRSAYWSALKKGVSQAKDNARTLAQNPGAALSYGAHRSAVQLGKLGKLGKGAVDKVSGMDKKQLLKGAALYGGLTVATGGVGFPAAVFAGRKLLAHRDAIRSGGASALASLGEKSRETYSRAMPDMGQVRSDMQFHDLSRKIADARTKGIAADGSDHFELAKDLPLGRERMIAAERESAQREFDAFAELNGREMNASEAEKVWARHPFANDVRDRELAGQTELPMDVSVLSGKSNHREAQVLAGGKRTVQGADAQVDVQAGGRTIEQHQAQLNLTPGRDTIVQDEVEVQHKVDAKVNPGQDTVRTVQHQVDAQAPGQTTRTQRAVHTGTKGEQILGSGGPAARRETVTGGRAAAGSAVAGDIAAAARRTGASPAQAQAVADSAPLDRSSMPTEEKPSADAPSLEAPAEALRDAKAETVSDGDSGTHEGDTPDAPPAEVLNERDGHPRLDA